MALVEVAVLAGGTPGWKAAGHVLFSGVNVPSKAFGEWVEAGRHTPSVTAPELRALLSQQANMVILDARRFDEYRTMSIPGGVSVPGGRFLFSACELGPSAEEVLAGAGMTPAPARSLDERVDLTVWRRLAIPTPPR